MRIGNMAKNPNPQGKGVVPLLAAWEENAPATIAAKSPQRIVVDYFTSLLVLSAEFHFKPVVGNIYYLYWRKRDNDQTSLILSLIEPERASSCQFGHYVGSSQLQNDMTWSIALSPALAETPEVLAELQQFHHRFINNHNNDKSLEENLPVFVESLPFYRRLAATAMSSSLMRSIASSQRQHQSARQWLLDSDASALQLIEMKA